MYMYFIINGILLLFAYPLLFILEKTFGFTSNVTLVELSNINNKLLREMSEVAPGTFQHSLQMANLAAEAANHIGANSQLVRTGALYHDIGKRGISNHAKSSSLVAYELLKDKYNRVCKLRWTIRKIENIELLPSQTDNAGKVLTTDGTNASQVTRTVEVTENVVEIKKQIF